MTEADKLWDWKRVHGTRGFVPEQMVARGIVTLVGGTVLLSLSVLRMSGDAFWLGIFLSASGFFLGGLSVILGIILHQRETKAR